MGRRSLLAGVGTPPAAFGAGVHHVVIEELIEVFRAALAECGARRANPAMLIRAAQHEVGARLADVRAVEQ